MCHGSECMGRPAPSPCKAEGGRTHVLITNRLVSPAALRPALSTIYRVSITIDNSIYSENV